MIFAEAYKYTKINQDLIYRLWIKKGAPGLLVINKYGILVGYRDTYLGEEIYTYDPTPRLLAPKVRIDIIEPFVISSYFTFKDYKNAN